MKKTKVTRQSTSRLTEKEIKESFRKQAIGNDTADYCVIDNNAFTELPDVSGCFKDIGSWIVYDTDERSQVYNVKKFASPDAAYNELANRLGFTFCGL